MNDNFKIILYKFSNIATLTKSLIKESLLFYLSISGKDFVDSFVILSGLISIILKPDWFITGTNQIKKNKTKKFSWSGDLARTGKKN